MEGSAPGVAGEVRLIYWVEGARDAKQVTSWEKVDASRDTAKR